MFFAGVVICDLVIHLLEDLEKPPLNIGWQENVFTVRIKGRILPVKWPSYSDTISLKRLLKKLSWSWFALAILLEIFAFPYSERIDDLSKQELTTAQKQAEASFDNSVKANERAGDAIRAASNNEREAARLEKEAEHERLSRVKLEAQIQPRELTLAQQMDIASACKRFSGHTIEIRSYVLDGEGWRLAQEIKAALEVGGIHVSDLSSRRIEFGGFIVGVLIGGPAKEQGLIDTLKMSIGGIGKIILTEQTGTRMINEEVVTILVGVKPPVMAIVVK